MYLKSGCDEDWHVFALAILFAIISMGNLFTLMLVFIRKLLKGDDLKHLATKYQTKSD
jgi:hypothetical protein